MSTTLTLKNIPDEVYHRLKASASANRRSLNMEAIVVLETGLAPAQASIENKIAAMRRLRQSLSDRVFDHGDIDAFKREGRE